jgi:hypothetical protein
MAYIGVETFEESIKNNKCLWLHVQLVALHTVQNQMHVVYTYKGLTMEGGLKIFAKERRHITDTKQLYLGDQK